MQALERRKKILKFIYEKGPLSYEEILDIASRFSDPVDILSDLDILVFFRFLQNVGVKRSLMPETLLELRPETEHQIRKNTSRIDSRLIELAPEIPPWYRKRAILTILNRKTNEDEILEEVHKKYPHVIWPPVLIKASLRILIDGGYVSREKQHDKVTYIRSSLGELLLNEPLIVQFFALRQLQNEFTNEFRILEILKLIITHKGISSGDIIRHLQTSFGMRGNKKRAITNILKNMTFSGLLRISGRYIYHPGEITESLFPGGGEIMQHDIKNFNETVKQFFEKYKHTKDAQLSIGEALYDLDLCKEDLSQKPPDLWVNHIVALLSSVHQQMLARVYRIVTHW